MLITIGLIAELRPQEWSPILILRGMLAIFYGHMVIGKRNDSQARPYVRRIS